MAEHRTDVSSTIYSDHCHSMSTSEESIILDLLVTYKSQCSHIIEIDYKISLIDIFHKIFISSFLDILETTTRLKSTFRLPCSCLTRLVMSFPDCFRGTMLHLSINLLYPSIFYKIFNFITFLVFYLHLIFILQFFQCVLWAPALIKWTENFIPNHERRSKSRLKYLEELFRMNSTYDLFFFDLSTFHLNYFSSARFSSGFISCSFFSGSRW